jgi:hypothetical protein
MKKSFPLHLPGKADARVVEAVKHDVRKYVQRERRKALPPDFSVWDFACKVGTESGDCQDVTWREIGPAIDSVVSRGADSVYIEVVAVPSHRPLAVPPNAG